MPNRKERTLKFYIHNNSKYSFVVSISKLDRKEAYGVKETHVVDEYDRECEIGYITDFDSEIIPKGGFKLSNSNSENTISLYDKESYPSSFDSTNYLLQTSRVSLFTLEVTKIYLISGFDKKRFKEFLGDNVYSFDFRWKAGTKEENACVFCVDDKVLMLVGKNFSYTPLAFEKKASFDDEDLYQIQEDDIDFAMF